jgi:hypothetical protein
MQRVFWPEISGTPVRCSNLVVMGKSSTSLFVDPEAHTLLAADLGIVTQSRERNQGKLFT